MFVIEQLHIYGFGKHVNKTITLQNGVNIFYGQNEAGKTTIQQFILQVFFGFPTKNSTLAKYEPKTSARFGGLIQLQHPKYGQCQIERVKGKAGGDVTVRLADGTVGHEELLAQLLYGYSRADFEAIFAFSIHQLQGIERMSEEELSRVLLASGTTGVDQLTKLERKLEKHIGELYKKSGKNPMINQKLEELKQTERQMQQQQQTIANYDVELSRLQQVEEEILSNQREQQVLQEQWKDLSKVQQALPLLEEQQLLEQELEKLTIRQFPTDGIRRYEQLKDRMQHFEVKIAQLTEQKTKFEQQLAMQFDANRYAQLQQLVEKESEWHYVNAQIVTLQTEYDTLVMEIDNHFRLLGIEAENERQQVIAQNVSLQQEEHFQMLLAQLEQLEERQKLQLLTIERVRDELEEIENRLRYSQREQPTEEERQLFEQWPVKKQRLEQLKEQVQFTKRNEEVSYKMVISMLVLATVTLLFGLWQKNWAVLVIGIVLLVIGVQFFRTAQLARQTKEQEANLRQILHEIRELEQQAVYIDVLKEKIIRFDDHQKSLLEQRQSKLSQYKQVEQALASFEVEQANYWEELAQFLNRFFIDGVTQRKLLPELFTRVREIQRLTLLATSKREALQKEQPQQQQMLEQASLLTGQHCTKDTLYVYVRQLFQQMDEHKKEANHLEKQLAEKQAQLALEDAEYSLLKQNMAELYKQANVTDEHAFYVAEESYKLYLDKQTRLQFIQNQLASIQPPALALLPTQEIIAEQLLQTEQQQQIIQTKLEQLLSEKATLQYNTQALLTDEQYGMLLQIFEQQKAELAEMVAEWSIEKAIIVSIEKVMTVLREEKLPNVLEHVNELFYTLTGSRYQQLSMNAQGNFEALSIDGVRYDVAELSQATKEQAYVALRFALAKSLYEMAPFPFIMDDPFVHFDRNRFNYMVQLMEKVKYSRQLLYFTCRSIIKDDFKDACIIEL